MQRLLQATTICPKNIPEIFSKEEGIRVGVIPTNNKKSIQIKLQCCFFSLLKLNIISICIQLVFAYTNLIANT
jgi:hypothetical protein